MEQEQSYASTASFITVSLLKGAWVSESKREWLGTKCIIVIGMPNLYMYSNGAPSRQNGWIFKTSPPQKCVFKTDKRVNF